MKIYDNISRYSKVSKVKVDYLSFRKIVLCIPVS